MMTGAAVYVQDMKPKGTVFGSVVRPPSYGAKLTDLAFHGVRTDELWAVGYGDDALYRGSGVGTGADRDGRVGMDLAAISAGLCSGALVP